MVDDLASGLIQKLQGDAVFPAGIAGSFQNLHIAKLLGFIQKVENPARHIAICLISGVQQHADDRTRNARRRFQDLQGHFQEHGHLAAQEVFRLEAAPGNQHGVGLIGEPAGQLRHVADHAAERLIDQAAQIDPFVIVELEGSKNVEVSVGLGGLIWR